MAPFAHLRHGHDQRLTAMRGPVQSSENFRPLETPMPGSFRTPTDQTTSIAHMLWDAASRNGSQLAISERDRSTTYDALRAHAAAVAGDLVARGVRPRDRVAIFLERGADAAAAYFGAVAAGCIVTFINERMRPRQLEYVLGHTSAAVLITSAEMLSRQPRAIQADAAVVDIADIPAAGVFEPVPMAGDQLVQLVYTSGSTGLPKGVAFTHANVWSAIQAITAYLGLTNDDRIASLIPFSSVYGLNQMLCAITMGAVLVVERSPIAHQILSGLRESAATVLAAVPPLWVQLLAVPAFASEPLPSLRLLQNAGGHLPTDAVRRIRQAYPRARLYLQYGMTETFRSTFLAPEEVDRRPDSMGKAIPGAEVFVLREDGTECDPDEVGELVHRGPTVAAGYWNDPEMTSRVFRPFPMSAGSADAGERVVFSGDLVRRDADGYLYYVSRRDRLIKSLGFRIGPDEIVDVLFASGEILEAVVTTEPDDQRGERVIAHVVLVDEGSLERLERFCRVELPRHMQPARIEVRAEMPRLASGKYDLAGLRTSRVTT